MKRTPLRRKTPLRRTRRKKSLRHRLWPEFSKLVRARDTVCLMSYSHGQAMGFGACGGSLQASHIYPKGAWPLLMLYPLNVIALCYRHHFHVWHASPGEAWTWVRKALPAPWRDQLEAMRVVSLSRKGMDEAAIRAEWARCGLDR